MAGVHSPGRQRGTTAVEFAIVASVLFTIVFGVVEFGRVIFTLNVLNEGARRAARVAVVCPLNAPQISTAALFTPLPGTPPTVTVSYLDATGAVIGSPATNYGSIDSVRVTLAAYQMPLAIPLLNLTYSAPPITSTLPRESLGVARYGASPAC